MPPISVMIKPVSGSCNMKCEYCFYRDEQEKRNRKNYGIMDQDTLRMIIDKMLSHGEGLCTISFQGGEPALAGLDFYRQAVEYAARRSREGISLQYSFQTNGTLIDRKWCEFFRQNHVLVGVSLDGIRSTHDRYRRFSSGAPTWDRVLDGIGLLEEYGVEYNILTVVHRETALNIRRIYHFYREMGWDFQQYIPCLDPLYEQPGKHGYSLTPQLYGRFLTELFHCWYEDYRKGCQPCIRQFENYLEGLLGYLPESCEYRGICGIQYAAEANGDIYPCDFYMLDEYLLGNIRTHTIAAMDARRESLGFLESSRKHSQKCTACPWHKICRNGCMRCRMESAPAGYLNYFCEGYRIFFENCYPQLQAIARDLRVQGFPASFL